METNNRVCPFDQAPLTNYLEDVAAIPPAPLSPEPWRGSSIAERPK